jgi:hypothetical protein
VSSPTFQDLAELTQMCVWCLWGVAVAGGAIISLKYILKCLNNIYRMGNFIGTIWKGARDHIDDDFNPEMIDIITKLAYRVLKREIVFKADFNPTSLMMP